MMIKILNALKIMVMLMMMVIMMLMLKGLCQFSKTLISVRFNLHQFCPSVASVDSVMLF